MFGIGERVAKSARDRGILLRPNSSPGLWVTPLLPIAIITSALKHPRESSDVYNQSALFGAGMLATTLVFILQCLRRKDITKVCSLHLFPASVTCMAFYSIFAGSFIFSFLSGLTATIGFYKVFLNVLKRAPRCFSIGEAALVSQGVTIFTFAALVNMCRCFTKIPKTDLEIATLIIQLGLLTVGFLCVCCYKFSSCRSKFGFYALLVISVAILLFLPLHILLRRSPVLWLVGLLTKRTTTVLFYWSICISIAVVAINRQIVGAQKASTVVRKTFHVLAVLVYVPGLLFECTLLYTASGILLGLFIGLELLRLLNIPPLGQSLQDGFIVFCDEKDAGGLSLTPIYLLVGISLPVWIHPAPCDLTDSTGFYFLQMMSGLLSIGIGDSAASIVGSAVGRHKWKGSNRSVEGTIACLLAQACVVVVMFQLGWIVRGHQQIIKSGIACIAVSLIEAKTGQVDNLVLPLVMYIILS